MSSRQLIARGQATIYIQKDSYTISQSLGEYVFPADHSGKILSSVTLTSTIKVILGDSEYKDFTIGAIIKPTGFSSIIVDNSRKTVTYTVASGTTTLAEHGSLDIPVTIAGAVYRLSFVWSKAKAGAPGTAGADANLLDWVREWNTGKTLISSHTVITPKLFAGVKNTDGTITGTAIGRFALSTKTASGSIATETIDGICGFRNGYKTFLLDNGGNVQLGYGDQFVRYDAATGKITFGAGVSLNWTNAIQQAKTETLNAAAATAQSKADAALGSAKSYADTKKSEAVNSAAATAQSKADAALNSAKSYADTKKSEAITQAGKDADSKISALTTTLNVSIADAKKAGTDARAVADAITSKANTEGWSNKLTYIDANGIFTGKLSANTVSAININASQITAGTIATARLNAAEIRSNIINAAYINGLTCAFVRGTIGGWTIGATTLSNSHILLDSGNKRVVVYGASSGATSGKRVQIYYNSDTDFGFYATDAAGNCLARFGSANQIAGWNIDANRIYKNSIALGVDGSITNGSKWKLNNDGSGSIASGNISWNAAGAVTFSAAVSVNWKNDIEAAKRTNFGYPYYHKIIINGEEDKYYPVIFKGGDQTFKRDILIRRAYSEQAPDSWNTTTHKGGLILLLKTNFGGWGGIGYSWDIYELSETYCRMFAGAQLCGNCCMFAVFLRGGGTTGAVYHLYSNQPIVSSAMSPAPIPAAPQIAYSSDLIFQSGSSQTNAPTPRTLTAAVEEEIRRRRFIALAQNSDNTLTAHPLTYIGSTGIYTGTLTAAQVNAVAIDAGSIRTGTLSADRIAAGSINSSKLDAASIKANIINTDYINGLTCTFVRGKIGGWTIGADNITAGSIGAIGAMPIQIRSAASGSGYWYNGAYKPLGIVMTWHQNNNAGHVVFGQIAASGSTVKTGFLGIQMMTWDNVEYFCLSANYTKSGAKEIYNRIAGWAFDNSRIWKNNVSLGADGSITNGTRWKLNNDGSASFGSGRSIFNTDGSGQVANGKFKWDAAGNIIAQGGKFKDVTIQGTIRSAFVQNDPSIWIVVGGGTTSEVQTDPVHYDNVVCTQSGGWNENINLQWTLENSGRRICLVNYKWGSTVSTGVMSITAPSGKYFYEDGISKTTLKFSREVIEMIGYGDDKTFFGWIVLNRRDLMTTSRYGKFQQILVTGIVTGTTSSASIRYFCFDGSKSVSVSRLGKGMYRVYLPSSWGLSSRYLVMATGIYSTAENTPIYPTVKAIYSYYFDIYTQDDASRNDGSFNFQVISTADWDL